KFELNKDDFGNLLIKLKNVDENNFKHIYVKSALVIRNYIDYSCFYTEQKINFKCITKDNCSCGWNNYLDYNNLYIKRENPNRSLIENNKTVIGASINTYVYNKDLYIRDIENTIDDEGQKVLESGYYEWVIDNWNDKQFSSNFELCDETQIDNEDYVSIFLYNQDVQNDSSTHIYCKFKIMLRNYDDYSYYYTNNGAKFHNYNENHNNWGWFKYIKNVNLFVKDSNNKSLIENDKVIVGVYIRIYKYNKDLYIEEVKDLISDDIIYDNSDQILCKDYYEWSINDWKNQMNSPIFNACGHQWKIQLNQNDYNIINKDYISAYLENIDVKNDNTSNIYAKCLLIIRNSNDYSRFYSNRDIKFNYFCKNNNLCKWDQFIKKKNLYKRKEQLKKSIVQNNKAQYMEEIKSLINDDDLTIIDEGYHELKITNWDEFISKKTNNEFIMNGRIWNIQFDSYKNDLNKEYIYVNLENKNINSSDFTHIYAKCLLIIRNIDDYSCFYTDGKYNLYHCDDKLICWNFIEKENLYEKNKKTNKSLIENNSTIIGAYIKFYKYNKDQYLEKLQGLIGNDSQEILGNYYYEWTIDDWEMLSNGIFINEFIIDNNKWNIILDSRDSNDGYLSIFLKYNDSYSVTSMHLYAKCLLVIRNYDDYSCFFAKSNKKFEYINKNNDICIWNHFIKKEDLSVKTGKFNKSLIENNKIIIGIFIQTHKYEHEQYIGELKSLLKESEYEILRDDYYEFEINNWNKNIIKQYDHEFMINKNKWKIQLLPNEENNEYISVSIKNINEENNIYSHICNKYVLSIRNPNDYSYFYANEGTSYHYYNRFNDTIKYDNFIKKDDLFMKNKGCKSLIENNKFVIGAYICSYKYNKDLYMEELKYLINNNGQKIINDGYYEWNIDDWEKFLSERNEQEFEINGYKWIIKINSIKNNKYMSIDLISKDVENDKSVHICIKCLLTIRNYKDYSCYYTTGESDFNYYNRFNNSYKWNEFIKKENLMIKSEYSNKYLIENNKAVIGAYIRIYEYTNEYIKII
ncbi:hypothetical protein PIROE2DRAFT_14472, partial [Piromyces sp. E2]